MAATRIGDGAVLSLQQSYSTAGTYTVGSFTSGTHAPSGGFAIGDLMLMLARPRSVVDFPNSLGFVSSVTGWTEDAAMPGDNAGTATQNSYLYSRIYAGTSADWPDVKFSKTGSGTSSRQANYSGHMFGYRGGSSWSVLATGSLGPTDGTPSGSMLVGGKTPATNTPTLTLPSGHLGIIISWAANANLATIPTLHTANGFTDQYSNDDASNTLTMPVRLADLHFSTSGVYALPRWTVDQGNSSTEHHAVWVAYSYGPTPEPLPFLAGYGITTGTPFGVTAGPSIR